MRRALAVLALLGLASPCASASLSQCGSIQDRETKIFCRATVSGNVAECGSLSDSHARTACRAKVTGSATECASLRGDARTYCLAQNR